MTQVAASILTEPHPARMNTRSAADGLRLRRILVVEDEYLIARALCDALGQRGVIVVGPAADVPGALALADEEPLDAAILDLNLAGRFVYPVADVLQEAGVPIIVVTGYDEAVIPARYQRIPRLTKPCDLNGLVETLQRLM